MNRCKKCREFFSRFRCSAATHGECDCPKCQGYCTCRKEFVAVYGDSGGGLHEHLSKERL